MARGKVAVTAPAAKGTMAYGLAIEHHAALEARLARLQARLARAGAKPEGRP